MRLSINRNWILELWVAFMLGVSALAWAISNIRLAGVDLGDEADLYLPRVFDPSLGYSADWGPLYIQWYRALKYFQPDPLELYYTSGILLIAFSVLALFFLLRRLGVGLFASSMSAFVFLMLPDLIAITRRPNHLAFVLAALTLGIAQMCESFFGFVFVSSLGLLITSYVRPEFFAGFAFGSAVLLFLTLEDLVQRNPSGESKTKYVWLPLLAILALVIIRLFELPLGAKSIFVFYGKNSLRLQLGYEDIQRLYGNADTVPNAFFNNPFAFLSNSAFYFINSIKDTRAAFAALTYLFISPVPLFVAASVAAGKAKDRLNLVPKRVIFTACFFCGPTILACTLYGGMPQYMFTVWAALLAGAIALTFRNVGRAGAIVLATAFTFWFIAAPNALRSHLPPWFHFEDSEGVLKSLEYLKSAELNQPANILIAGAGGVWSLVGKGAKGSKWCYSEEDFCPSKDTSDSLNFRRLLADNGWNAVIIKRSLARAFLELPKRPFNEDVVSFISNPESYGFSRIGYLPLFIRSKFSASGAQPALRN